MSQFGPNKYAALHLMLARWIRETPGHAAEYVYVTLGGSALSDIESAKFVSPSIVRKVVTFEEDKETFKLTKENADRLRSEGLDIEPHNKDFFTFRRETDLPHLFFLDLIGICAWGDMVNQLGDMFQRRAIREGDGLLITSHLGHNPGLPKIRKAFGGEFSILGITGNAAIKQAYRCFHPSFTLYQALNRDKLASELNIRCLGCVKYRDGSPMGLYGYVIGSGSTALKSFIRDPLISYFDISKRRGCAGDEF